MRPDLRVQQSSGSAVAPDNRVAIYVWGARQLGGAERRFFRLSKYLQESGRNVCLYTSVNGIRACESLGIEFESKNVRVFPGAGDATPRLLRYPHLIRQVIRLVAQLRRDQVRHLHFGGNPGPLTLLYGLLARWVCPFSVSLVDSIGTYRDSLRERTYVRAACRFSSRIDCLSTQIKEDLRSLVGTRYDSKHVVAPCSFTDFKATASSMPASRGERDIDVSIMARMVPGKGYRLLKEALLELSRRNRPGLVVQVCGSGPLAALVKREFGELEKHRIGIGFEKNPFQILRRTKVYVSLQDTENYPSQSLLEAMICECGVVATDVGLTRLLLDESCGRLVPGDPIVLADAIEELLGNEELRSQLGRNARQNVVRNHSVERFASYFMTSVAGGQPEGWIP